MITIEEFLKIRKISWDGHTQKKAKAGHAAHVVADDKGWKTLNAFDDIKNLTRQLENEDTSNFKVIDFGCGVGRLIEQSVKKFGFVTGIDISKPVLEGAHQYLKAHNADLKKIELLELNSDGTFSLESNSYDFAYSLIVLQHIRHRNTRIKHYNEISRVLKSGALACFQYTVDMPSVGNFNDNIGLARNQSPDWTFYSGDDFSIEFDETPFKLIDVFELKHPHGNWVFLTVRNENNTQ